ncbi:MAG: bifunctional folylpolyglutamate synthase/dihydrofolate synthase, partial [Lachnospiraceae bacterium]|nr:bifunctional folylpolyglutamate synthase/dihydrofolate synthase [Lachnospiraceae bacterium]
NEIKDTGLEFTRYELETAMALLYFKRKDCDYAIIECGMGGRDDATNVFKINVLSVFAAIGMDHMAYLGDTVEKIANNKAGIIKPGGRCVINGTSKEALNAIKAAAEEKKNPLYVYDPGELKKVKLSLTGASFDYKAFKNVKISLLGTYQPDNAATAIEACLALRDSGVKISDRNIYDGLHNTTEPGRFEVISKSPLTVIDGAHNEPASIRLRESIQKYFPDKKLIYIIGVLKDKEYDKVIENTCDLCEHVITVTAHNKTRALSAFDLALSVKKVNPTVTTADSVDEAVELAYMLSDKDSAVIAFGSLSYLFQVKKAVDKYKDKVKEWHRQYDR